MPKERVVSKKIATKADNDKPQKGKALMVNEGDEEAEKRRTFNRELKSRAMNLFSSMRESRKRYDWEWLTRDLYRRGYQFSSYNNQTKTVVLSTTSAVRLPINLLWAQMRVIRNQVTSFRPKWEVLPTGKSEQSLNNARYSGKLLDYYFDRLNLRKMIKETVTQGLTYSVGGPWQIMYDPDADNGEGEVRVDLVDTFDFFWDMNATGSHDAEFGAKAIRKPVDEVRNDPKYTFYQKLTKGDKRQAESEYKQFLLLSLKYYEQYTLEEAETMILKEFWWKTRVNDDNREKLTQELKENDQDIKDIKDGEVLMRVVTYTDLLEDPLRVQLIRRSDYPFEMYQADINPVEMYGESWAKHVIPMNRVVNALESSVFQYNYKYAKGRIVIDKNSGVSIINNEHGSIIQKNVGAEVSSLHLAPLPPSYQDQIANMRRYIEDIGGAHDISLGRVPTGVKSGVGIAELKQADSTNQADLVDNLEDFLVQVGKKILKEIAENYDVPRVIKALGKSGSAEHFAVIGDVHGKKRKNQKEVTVGTDTFDLAQIGADNEIRVTIGSWLAYTKSAQYEKLRELFESGTIDQKTFLEHLEFNDVQNIVDKTREEKLLEKMSTVPAAGSGGVTDQEIAQQENIMIMKEGRTDVNPEPTDAHIVHKAIHQDYADNELMAKHMEKHDKMMIKEKTNVVEAPLGAPDQQLPMETLPPEQTPMSPGMAPELPPGPLGVPTPGSMGGPPPSSPEEDQLIQSLMALGG